MHLENLFKIECKLTFLNAQLNFFPCLVQLKNELLCFQKRFHNWNYVSFELRCKTSPLKWFNNAKGFFKARSNFVKLQEKFLLKLFTWKLNACSSRMLSGLFVCVLVLPFVLLLANSKRIVWGMSGSKRTPCCKLVLTNFMWILVRDLQNIYIYLLL